MKLLFNIASRVRKIYWYIFRPKTIGVKCLIECDEEYLFIKHTYENRTHNWNLPGGGLKNNESIIDAVGREVLEELNIKLDEVIELKKYISNAEYKVDTVHCFYSRVESKDFEINKNELREAKWFPKNNLPKNIARSIKESLGVLQD